MFLQVWITVVGFVLGVGIYGPCSLYGVMAIEAAPTHLAGAAHATVALAANGRSFMQLKECPKFLFFFCPVIKNAPEFCV